MPALVREQWPLGWTPSADDTNGDPAGLVRADNLRLDERGALTLTRGFKNINSSQFPGYVHSVYSTSIYNQKHRFVGLSTGQVLHAPAATDFSDEILSGGNPARARFSDIFGSIFVSSGTKRKKLEGSSKYNWGLETPKSAPVATVHNQEVYSFFDNYGAWSLVEGDNFDGSNGVHVDPDTDTNRAIVGILSGVDLNAFPGGGHGLDTDIFSFRARLGDSARCDRIRVEFGIGSIGSLQDMPNYYWMEWQHDVDQVEFLEGIDAYTTLQCKRGDFQRAGDDASLDWSSVTALRVSMIFSDVSLDNIVTDFQFTGSSQGPLNGDVQYVQVNVRDNGTYQAKSGASPQFAQPVTVINGSVGIVPVIPADSQFNQIWFFRQGGALETYLRIGVLDYTTGIYTDSAGNTASYGGSIIDICPDSAAQDLNLEAKLTTVSVQDIEDEFLCIVEGIYFERAVISTAKEILLSESLNPDAIEHRLKVSGDKTESILWITRVSNTLLIVGTTKNLYELSGNLVGHPDGLVEATIRPLGEKHPPLSLEFALDSGSIIYMADDGWRITTGGPSSIISPQLDLLYKKRDRYGISQVQLESDALIVYPVAVYKGEVITSNPLLDGSRPIFAYDLKFQYWRLYECNPICLFVESDGTLIGGFGNPNDYYVKTLDFGETIDTQGVTSVGQRIYFQTVYDANQQPRNRKEAYTLKLLIDTGGKPVNVYIAGDEGGFVGVGQVQTDYLQNVFIDVHDLITESFGLGFRYAIRITSDGYNLTRFRLAGLTIEYDPRPELLTTLTLLPTNLGTISRKRITNFAFVIDTLGFDVQFQPRVDGVDIGDPITFSHTGKKTIVYYFEEEVLGTDIGGKLEALDDSAEPISATNRGAFEYYGLDLGEIISEKLPVPVKYLVIPANDYGNPNRKRHSSYKFSINTRGFDVRFTPKLDGVTKTPATYNTSEKRTVEYFFTSDTIAIDIGGILQTLADTPFEYYGTIIPQQIEVLPPRLKEFYSPETNYGIPAKKRIRTMPMEINTNGFDVTFTPIIDGVAGTSSVINTPSKKTAFHYFDTDIFGVDFACELVGSEPFEFYGLLKPENVEALPVGKKFDQIGPVHLARIGKLVGFRIRAVTGQVDLPWRILAEDTSIATGTLVTVPNTDDVYEAEFLTKGRIAVVSRIELGPTATPFHRYYLTLKVNYGDSGNNTDIKLITLKDAFSQGQ